MNQHEFETAVLRMWTTTRIPLTRVNLQVYTGAPRTKIESWMNDLARAGIVDLDSDDDGEAFWNVRGAARSKTGPRSIDEMERLGRLVREVEAEGGTRRVASVPRTLALRSEPGERTEHDEKSLVASGVLSFVLGPVGWLYAAPLKDAIPALVAVMLISSLLPYGIAASLLGVLSPLSAAAGVIYAWRYNQTGRRASMLDFLSERTRPKLPPMR
jgi:hypothetical protein